MRDGLRLTTRISGSTRYDVTGPVLAAFFESKTLRPQDDSAALLFALPIAMRTGQPLHVGGKVSATVLQGARTLSWMWPSLKPGLFSEIEITADEITPDAPPADGPELLCFSGGIDSTYALLNHEGNGTKPDLLTVHGLDYRLSDNRKFDRLQAKTAGFRAAHAGTTHVLRTDAASVYRRHGIPMTLGFGFILGAALRLFSGSHRRGWIAADVAHYLECISGAYGTNSAMSPLMGDPGFGIGLLGGEASRLDKIAALASNDEALQSISVCKDYPTRPENCGFCAKCVRTKGHFYATTGRIPQIFNDTELTAAHLANIDVSQEVYAEPWARMIRIADAAGRGAVFDPVRPLLATRAAPRGFKFWRYRLWVAWKAFLARRKNADGRAH